MTDIENGTNGANPEEALLKELREADWTEDHENEEDDFDLGDLVCVDDEGEEQKNDERRRIREASPDMKRYERRRLSDRERFEPYPSSSNKRRHESNSNPKKHSPARIARDKRRKQEYIEKRKAERAATKNQEGTIDLDELEEVDSVDDTTVAANEESIISSSSSVNSSIPAPEDDDDPWAKRIRETDVASTMDDEEFPSLSEEIDPEVLRKIAQNQPPIEPSSISLPSTTTKAANSRHIKETEYTGSLERKESTSKYTKESKSRSDPVIRSKDRHREPEEHHKNGHSESRRSSKERRHDISSRHHKIETQSHHKSHKSNGHGSYITPNFCCEVCT